MSTGLKTLLPEVIIKKQYVFTDKIDDFEKVFVEILPHKTTNKTILWRLESSNEDGTGHNFVLKITGNKILILDPAEATVPLYSAKQEKVQIQTIAKKYRLVKVKYTPFGCTLLFSMGCRRESI